MLGSPTFASTCAKGSRGQGWPRPSAVPEPPSPWLREEQGQGAPWRACPPLTCSGLGSRVWRPKAATGERHGVAKDHRGHCCHLLWLSQFCQ